MAPIRVQQSLPTPIGDVPVVATSLTTRDKLGHWKVRWGIGRERFTVSPGIYAVGNPDADSPVLVTANFRMSIDRVRASMTGRSAWVLVLDTKGINVWCAAGKGTFGTEELLRRIERVRLGELVRHRKLVLPQLGATGVSAQEVRKRTGWQVIWGPVHVKNLPAFLDTGMKATRQMRRVEWTLADRVVLVPVEMMGHAKYLLIAAVCFLLLAGLGSDGYSLNRILTAGTRDMIPLVMAYLSGTVLTPTLLPWLPGRAFSLKGVWTGLLAAIVLLSSVKVGLGLFSNGVEAVGWILLAVAISSYLAMNFTGASTYTSLSGVRREMRVAVPMQIAVAFTGMACWLYGRFA